MKEDDLLKVAVCVSILGIVLLALITPAQPESSVFEANNAKKDEFVRIQGNISKVIHSKNTTIITLVKEEEISVAIFENVSLTKGQMVDVRGTIKEYKGKNEIIADRVVLI